MHRVVVTGMGVVAPNGSNVHEFEAALRAGKSGIRFQPRMQELNLHCQVAGQPEVDPARIARTFSPGILRATNSVMLYAGLAAIECWQDAGFAYDQRERGPVDWETGAIVGTGVGGIDTIAEQLVPAVNAGRARRMGSTIPEQMMSSSTSAFVAGVLGLGGEVMTLSSACATGTEALVQAFFHLRSGSGSRILAGSAEGASVYTWASFDAMRVCCSSFNEQPERASRPLSSTAGGFVPSAGAGIVMLETLESALHRGARIYAEVVGGAANCGGQRNGGTISASNPAGMERCMRMALCSARMAGSEIEYINGHLTATKGDALEVGSLMSALQARPETFPWLNATKSLIGHALGGAGAIEAVGTLLQLDRGFIHPSLNSEDLHPDVLSIESKLPRRTMETRINSAMKVSFGFGDVNACIIFRKWDV